MSHRPPCHRPAAGACGREHLETYVAVAEATADQNGASRFRGAARFFFKFKIFNALFSLAMGVQQKIIHLMFVIFIMGAVVCVYCLV